jgi:hypothetical protein
MPALDSSSARPAPTHRHGNPGHRRAHLRHVDLELLGVAFVVDVTAAVRTAPRQRRGQLPVRVGRRHPVAVPAVSSPRLRPGRAGSSYGSPFENGAACRLPDRRDSSSSFSNSAIRLSRVASDSFNSVTVASRRATTRRRSATTPARSPLASLRLERGMGGSDHSAPPTQQLPRHVIEVVDPAIQ